MRLLTYSLVQLLVGFQLASGESISTRSKNTHSVKTYPIPTGVNGSTAFDVKVRTLGGKWQHVDTYKPIVVETDIFTGATAKRDSSMAYFDFGGTVEVTATYKNGPVPAARVRPDSFGITPSVHGTSVTFKLSKPQNVVLQIGDEIFDVLHLFTNPIEHNVPSSNDPEVIYFKPGLHTLANPLNVTSGQTVYVAGGAVVSVPGVNFNNVTNASIRGRGLLVSTVEREIAVSGSSQVVIDGIIGFNVLPRSYHSDDVTIRNFRSFSDVQWGDGIDVYCSNNILMDGIFMRNSDDCVAIYNHRYEMYGNNTNITLQNSVLWADVAHPINIGTHGNTDDPETTDGLTIRNIDILDHHEKQIDYQGCIAINPGDGNMIQNVVIDDVRVEDFRLGQLLNMRVMYNEKYNTSPGRGIRNVTISNLVYWGTHALDSVMAGYDGDRTIQGVNFENLEINGLAINDGMKKPAWYRTTDYMPMYIGPHVYNVTLEA